MRWWSAGNPVEALPFHERAIHYGDGLFETIALRDGQPRLWPLHWQRLADGCHRLGISVPSETGTLQQLERGLDADPAAAARGTAKLIVSAGTSPRGYARDSGQATTVHVGIGRSTPVDPRLRRSGVRVRWCRTRLARQPLLAGLKTLNRLEQVLARAEWSGSAIFEGLTLDTEGAVICGTMSNLFIVTDGQIITPSLENAGVAGVMRRHLLDCLDMAGRSADVRELTVADVEQADEVFLSNSQFGLLPVAACGEVEWPCGPVTARCVDLLAGNGVVEGRQ